jgi:hypothetical protein
VFLVNGAEKVTEFSFPFQAVVVFSFTFNAVVVAELDKSILTVLEARARSLQSEARAWVGSGPMG